MDFQCQQQQRMEKDEDVSLPKKSCTEFAFDVCEPTAIVESKNRYLENLRQRLEEIEVEADELRHAMSKLEKEIGKAQGIVEGPTAGSAEGVKLEPKLEIKEEQDTRSIFVGNVDYACMPEEVQQHFQSCGTINRVTIMTDKYGQHRGFAYVEFVDDEAVQNALLLNETELHGRQLKVCVKRTNIPGMNQYLGMRPIPYYGYGSFPRFKRPMYYKPY